MLQRKSMVFSPIHGVEVLTYKILLSIIHSLEIVSRSSLSCLVMVNWSDALSKKTALSLPCITICKPKNCYFYFKRQGRSKSLFGTRKVKNTSLLLHPCPPLLASIGELRLRGRAMVAVSAEMGREVLDPNETTA